MVEKVISCARWLALLIGAMALPSIGWAHRLDEYLQASLVTIDPGEIRLKINLTPGVDVAERVLAVIDRNHDGIISKSEALAYSKLLKHNLLLQLDGRTVRLRLASSNFPAPTELRTGWGIIQLEFAASIRRLSAGAHSLTLKNDHLPDLSVYLFNAALPRSDSVHITGQKRNEKQSNGEILFTME